MTLAANAAHADTIVEIAAADDRFSTLVAVVTVETLLKPENRGRLTDILLYHVDDRKLTAGMIPKGSNDFKPTLTGARQCISAGADA